METSLHSTTKIGQVTLYISDLSTSLHFYQNQLGFQVIKQTSNVAYLSVDGETTLIVLEQIDQAVSKPQRTTGLYHFAVLVPDRPSLALALRRLLEIGYPLQGAADHDFSEAVYLSDPDGNGVELYRDRDRSVWKYDKEGYVHAPTVPLDADGLLQEAEGRQWNGMPAGTVIGHVHLHVGQLEAAETFYVQGLGFDPTVYIEDHALFVAAGGYHHHVGLNIWAGKNAPPPPEKAVGLKEYTLILASQKELKQAEERLEKVNASYECDNNTIVADDPSGNRIRLVVA
ncbi:catechol 2,3-dioxygenase [Salibacterium salarium]|uniref:VOC family protein n=1 Tax=Salibacterium salarium TaxID=284579 RepID=UPI002786F4D5|nr:VOC family protein [Salibacterium salarium]MDQ0297748.1 catechol 2,3-dioxygenase [Salibacterium salarium]